MDYYKKSADLGDPRGQRAYAFMLDNGRGVTKDSAKVVYLFKFYFHNVSFLILYLGFSLLYFCFRTIGFWSKYGSWK